MDDVLIRAIEEGNIFAVVFFLATCMGITWMLGCAVVSLFMKDPNDED